MKQSLVNLSFVLAIGLNAWAADNQLTPAEEKAGWTLLFDGKTTHGWHSFHKQSFPEVGWVVREGVLELVAGSKAGDIVSDATYSDFDLTWEWKIGTSGNNGLKYFVSDERAVALGHEYQMIDDPNTRDPGEKRGTAAFYDVLAPVSDKGLKPAGEWNRSRVLVQGNHVEHWLNGMKALEYELGSEAVLAAVQKSKFKTVAGFGTKVPGHILLTYHNDPVSYRNIKIRNLSSGKQGQ